MCHCVDHWRFHFIHSLNWVMCAWCLLQCCTNRRNSNSATQWHHWQGEEEEEDKTVDCHPRVDGGRISTRAFHFFIVSLLTLTLICITAAGTDGRERGRGGIMPPDDVGAHCTVRAAADAAADATAVAATDAASLADPAGESKGAEWKKWNYCFMCLCQTHCHTDWWQHSVTIFWEMPNDNSLTLPIFSLNSHLGTHILFVGNRMLTLISSPPFHTFFKPVFPLWWSTQISS